MKCIKTIVSYTILIMLIMAIVDARPPSGDVNQDIDVPDQSDYDDIRAGLYELPSMPIEHMKMLIAHYRPNAYLRSPSYNSFNDYLRSPESKRQVRYRQCYFNPISCFKK